jgi:hypothetical protein
VAGSLTNGAAAPAVEALGGVDSVGEALGGVDSVGEALGGVDAVGEALGGAVSLAPEGRDH